MTRREFDENVTEWYELRDVMEESDYSYRNDDYIMSDGEYDDAVAEDLREDVQSGRAWYYVLNSLDDLPDSCRGEYYRRDGMYDYHMLDQDDFYETKDDVRDWLEDQGWFEEEEEDEEEDEDDGAGRDIFYHHVDYHEEQDVDIELGDDDLEQIA